MDKLALVGWGVQGAAAAVRPALLRTTGAVLRTSVAGGRKVERGGSRRAAARGESIQLLGNVDNEALDNKPLREARGKALGGLQKKREKSFKVRQRFCASSNGGQHIPRINSGHNFAQQSK